MRPLFITGLARSGTSLVARMIDAHPDAAISIDAFLPLFRALRNSIACAREPGFDTSLAMQDGYFSARQRARIAALWQADLDCPLVGAELVDLQAAVGRRAGDESGDLVPRVGALRGPTMRDLFDSALAIVGEARSAPDHGIVGMKDLWALDLLPALARSQPAAQFLFVMRDPRDMVASVLGFLSIDPSQVGHVLSALRHWRKSIATLHAFRDMPLFDGRLATVRYEDVVADPKAFADQMSVFLGLRADESMLQVARFRDYNTQSTWRGNSTFETALDAISAQPVGRWRDRLASEVLSLVELTCGPEMHDAGYVPSQPCSALAGKPEILDFLLVDGARRCSWRSDEGDAFLSFARESARPALLDVADDRLDDATVADAFLFRGYFDHLRAAADSRP